MLNRAMQHALRAATGAFANEPPAAPGMAWDVRCITEDYTQKAAVPCGWDRARAVISPAQHYQQAISVDASIKWTATITFYKVCT